MNCGQTFRGVVADCDPEYDLALVKIETPTRELLSPAKFGVAKDVSVGDTVLSIRNPLSYAKSFSAGKIRYFFFFHHYFGSSACSFL